MRDTIAAQAEQIRALKAQIDKQAEMIVERNIKIRKLAQARDRLQAHIDRMGGKRSRNAGD